MGRSVGDLEFCCIIRIRFWLSSEQKCYLWLCDDLVSHDLTRSFEILSCNFSFFIYLTHEVQLTMHGFAI